MSAETLQQPIDAEAELEFALAEAELQAAAEVAETQAAEAEIKAAAEYLLAHPPSSPIDWFASPPALTLPPPVAPTIRTPPRLKLRSSAAVEEEGRNGKASKGRKGHKSRRITRASKMSEKDVNMSAESGSEVDELESPIDLNPEECERLEAESLLTQRQSSESRQPGTHQCRSSEEGVTSATTHMPQSTPATATASIARQASGSPQPSVSSGRQASKSPFATSSSQRGPSPFANIAMQPGQNNLISSSQQQQRLSTPKASLDKHREPVRSQSNTPSSSQTGQKRKRGPSTKPITDSIDLTRDSPEPPAPSAKRAKAQPQQTKQPTPALSEEWVQDLMARSRGPRSPSPPAEEHVTDPRNLPSRPLRNGNTGKARAMQNSTNAKSSDDYIPLAATQRGVQGSECKATKLKTAMKKAEDAVKEMTQACGELVGELVLKLQERELDIDRLRAQLRVRPEKRDSAAREAGK